jgi:hypothetical protein
MNDTVWMLETLLSSRCSLYSLLSFLFLMVEQSSSRSSRRACRIHTGTVAVAVEQTVDVDRTRVSLVSKNLNLTVSVFQFSPREESRIIIELTTERL